MFVRLLGRVGVGADERTVRPVPGRVAAGVLAALVLARGRLVTFEALTSEVWDDPPETARNAVQVAVSRLRRLLGPDVVLTDGAGYRCPAALLRVDLDEAEQLVADARAAEEGGRADDALHLADSATSLFVGEPLAGLGTTTAYAVRQHVDDVRATAVLIRGRVLMALGRLDEAVTVLREEASNRPLAEPPHAALMEALRQAGRTADALGVYDALRRRLGDELGVDPAPQVVAVFRRLLDQAPGEPPAQAPEGVGPLVRLPVEAGPLIGRDEDLVHLDRLVAGGHRLVTLLGSGGVGKTRLAVAAAHRWAREHHRSAVFLDLSLAEDGSGVRRVAAEWLPTDAHDRPAPDPVIVLDNAEHVLEATASLALALLGLDRAQLLVTSRSPLGLREESVHWVGPLPARSPTDAAVRLLVDRAGLLPAEASAHRSSLHALARRADGLPLALEIVASALRWSSAGDLLPRLDALLLELPDRARDRPDRHENLAKAIGWSLTRTSADGRVGLGALLVPRGELTLELTEMLLAAALPREAVRRALVELVELSLLQRVAGRGEVRLRVLEPVRMVAESSHLVPAAGTPVHLAHATHYLTLLRGTSPSSAAAGQRALDEANLRIALEWSWEHRPELALEAVAPLLAAHSAAAGARDEQCPRSG